MKHPAYYASRNLQPGKQKAFFPYLTAMRNTTRQYLTALNILFYALLAGQLIFLGIATGLKLVGEFPNVAGLEQALKYASIIFVAGGYLAGTKLFNGRLAQLREQSNLQDQLNGYRGLSITRWALLEGPVLLTTVSYLLTGQSLLLGLAAGAIVLFITLRPGKDRIIRDLSLSSDAAAQLDKPDAAVL